MSENTLRKEDCRFENPFYGFFNDILENSPAVLKGSMRADIEESDKDILIHVEVPGVKKDDIKLRLKDGYLTVGYEFRNKVSDGYKRSHFERSEGRYRRDFYVGNDIKKEDIKANLSDGLLTVTVTKPVRSDTDTLIAIE